MKGKINKLLLYILKRLAEATLWKYRPGIIGVTGSVGKTSTKQAIFAVLGNDRRVRASYGNFNTTMGHPLTILGDWKSSDLELFGTSNKNSDNKLKKMFFIAKVILFSAYRLVFKKTYPELLILEYGVDRPGDMRELLQIVRPNIAIITAIGEVPAHVEYFSGPEAVAREKSRLIEFLPAAGFAILNNDDLTVTNIKDRTRAKIINYGFNQNSTVRITNFEHKASVGGVIGINFKIEYGGSYVPVRIDNCIGKGHAYAACAATCVGLIFGLNLVKIAENFKNYVAPKGRSLVCKGIKNTIIIDDSYNASPMSMHAGLDTLRSLKAKRKIAVLGDMLEIGDYTIEEHQALGTLVSKSADILVTVGPRAKFIAEGAKKAKMSSRHIKSFDTSDEARIAIQNLIKKDDLILIKGSHGVELDKIVEEIKLPESIDHGFNAPIV